MKEIRDYPVGMGVLALAFIAGVVLDAMNIQGFMLPVFCGFLFLGAYGYIRGERSGTIWFCLWSGLLVVALTAHVLHALVRPEEPPGFEPWTLATFVVCLGGVLILVAQKERCRRVERDTRSEHAGGG